MKRIRNRKAATLIVIMVICFIIAIMSFSVTTIVSRYSKKVYEKKESIRQVVYDEVE